MNPTAIFPDFFAFSLGINSHPIATFSEFPDSRAFYSTPNHKLPETLTGFMYLATCNRVEIYAHAKPNCGLTAETVARTLSTSFPELVNFFKFEPVVTNGSEAIEHLMSVACGLKSLALGETQIAGQLKRDLAHAESAGFIKAEIGAILKKTLELQKKVRTSTSISRNSYSLLSLVETTLSERGITTLQKHSRVALIGASEMSAKIARYALRRGVREFLLVRKNLSQPMNSEMSALIAEYPDCFATVTYEDLKSHKSEYKCDYIYCASSGATPVLTREIFECLAKISTTPVIDLGLPANAGEDVITILSTRYVSISSLANASEAARAERAESAIAAMPIIRRAIYQLWLDSLYRENTDLVQTYLGQKTEESRSEWLNIAAAADLSEKQKRIMYDFIKKDQRRALAVHREMILDLIAKGSSTSLADSPLAAGWSATR